MARSKHGTPRHTHPAHRIIDAGEKNGVAFVVGDAAKAYGPDVTRARRTIAYFPSGAVAVFDDLVANTARHWEWNLQAVSAKLQPDKTIAIVNGPANACVDLYSEQPATTKIVRRQSPSVEREWGMSSHDHLVYAQDVATQHAQFVALFRFECKPLAHSVHFKNGAADVQVGATKLHLDQGSIGIMAFQ